MATESRPPYREGRTPKGVSEVSEPISEKTFEDWWIAQGWPIDSHAADAARAAWQAGIEECNRLHAYIHDDVEASFERDLDLAVLEARKDFERIGEALARALGHSATCRMLNGPDCNCGAAQQQAKALDDYEHWKADLRPEAEGAD
jgi:hypothetical protein